MPSGKLRHEMSMLLDCLDICYTMTTLGTTGGSGCPLWQKYGGKYRPWSLWFIYRCIQKKKINKENFRGTQNLSEQTVESILDPSITFEEFSERSCMAEKWASPYYSFEKKYCIYSSICVNRIVRQIKVDVNDASVFEKLFIFVTNQQTFTKKANRHTRMYEVD